MKFVRTGCMLFCALSVAVMLGACASMSTKFKAPRLTLIAASMASTDVFSQQFRVRVRVENPNALDLPIKSINYTLLLEGDNFSEGVSEAPFVVPANGEKEFDLNMQTNFVSSIARLLSRLTGTNRTTVAYAFTGYVTVDATFSPTLKFTESGAVDLARK
jgi:LEA14-like dessication related protein